MTATVIRFPVAASPRVDIVTAARAILRSPAPHGRETIREACHAMMTWGNAMDWSEAYPVLKALDLPPVAKPPYSAGTGLIRAALVDCAGLAVILGVAAMIYLEVWK